MVRVTVLAAMGVVMAACGNPCTRIAAGQSTANDRGKACSNSDITWTDSKVQRCEAGLSKCSAEDQKKLDLTADCLQKLPDCAQGQALSWGVSRFACAEPLVGVSLTCADAIR